MVVVVDIGNSYLHAGFFAAGRLRRTVRFKHGGRLTARRAGSLLKRLGARADRVAVASVVPAVRRVLLREIRRRWGVRPLVVTDRSITGLTAIDYERGSLGADRIAGATGAWRRHRRDLIVIDFGTATTLSVVDARGVFRGGAICPGVSVSLTSLVARTALLPRTRVRVPRHVIGRTTRDCLASGIGCGTVALVDGLVKRINKERRRRHLVIATGGWASVFARHCKSIDRCEPALNLIGLYEVLKANENP